MAAIVGVAFELAERMMRREIRATPRQPRDFATALFMGGVRTLPIAASARAGTHEGDSSAAPSPTTSARSRLEDVDVAAARAGFRRGCASARRR